MPKYGNAFLIVRLLAGFQSEYWQSSSNSSCRPLSLPLYVNYCQL